MKNDEAETVPVHCPGCKALLFLTPGKIHVCPECGQRISTMQSGEEINRDLQDSFTAD